jgi:hypothetical protein
MSISIANAIKDAENLLSENKLAESIKCLNEIINCDLTKYLLMIEDNEEKIQFIEALFLSTKIYKSEFFNKLKVYLENKNLL